MLLYSLKYYCFYLLNLWLRRKVGVRKERRTTKKDLEEKEEMG
jgi:hypothetical protein